MLTTSAPAEFVSVAELAAETGRTERTVWRWLEKSDVQRFRDLHGRTVIRRDDVPRLFEPSPI